LLYEYHKLFYKFNCDDAKNFVFNDMFTQPEKGLLNASRRINYLEEKANIEPSARG